MHQEYIRIVPGADTAILMVHGIVGTPRHFDFLIDSIPEDVSVVNILLPGHGGTVQDFGKASMAQWKEKVKNEISALCSTHRRILLIGHSMGTLLTSEVAECYPNIKGLLLINVPLRVQVAPRMVSASLRCSFGKGNPDRPADWGVMHAGVQLSKRFWLYFSWIPRFWELLVLCRQSRRRFETLSLPVYTFQSYDDELVRRSTSRHLLKNPTIRHIMLKGCGHFLYPPEAQEQMKNALKDLLSST